MTTTKVPEALLKRLRSDQRFLISSHVNPDGDAVGSSLGLARVLQRIGKGGVIWNRDETPKIYSHLAGSDRIHLGEAPPPGFPEAFDASIVLECPTLDRTGLQDSLVQLPVLNIDHHLGNEHYGVVNWIDTGAPSLGAMIYQLAQSLKVDLDPESATCLYLTLVTDTGGFRFANSTPEAFGAAAALVSEGAQPELVAKWIHESRPESAVRLVGEVLTSLELADGGRLATVVLTHEMMENAGATGGDTEGLIDYPRSVAGVEAVALLRQVDNEHFKVSLRSRGDVDVEKLARSHSGGGHKNAAGYLAEGDAATVRDQVVSELIEALG